MSDLLPDQSPAGWNRTSSAYNREIWSFMEPFVAAMIERAAPRPSEEALDVAAGTGAVTIPLAPRVKSVLATDFAEEMLEHLRKRVSESGLGNVEIRRMDGQALELEDASLDLAFSNFGLIFFPDRAKGFAEMHRVLRPGGRGVVSAWSTPDRFEAFGLFVNAVRSAVPELPKPKDPPPVFSLSDRDRFREEMSAAGFRDVQIESVRPGRDMENAEALWQLMSTSAPPAVFLLEKIGPEKAERVRERLIANIEERFGTGPFTLRNEAHIGVGVR